MVISLSRCCLSRRRVSQSPNCWSFCNVWGKMGEGLEDDDKAMVNDAEGVRSMV